MFVLIAQSNPLPTQPHLCPTAPPQGGHYVTYVKCRDGAWYLCDDAFISPASCEEVQNSQAYLLFYMDKSIDPWTVQ